MLASPVARSGIHLTLLERCVYGLSVEHKTEDPDGLHAALTRVLGTSADLRARLSAELGDISPGPLHTALVRVVQGSLPLWRCLGAIDGENSRATLVKSEREHAP